MSRRPPATVDDARAALAAGWPWLRDGAIARFGAGLINDTFAVTTADARFVLQRVHPVFSAEIHHNIAAVTAALQRAGLPTPRLVDTATGRPWVEHDAATWRVQTHVEGVGHDAVADPRQAEAAGEFLGRFHSALDGITHDFVGLRTGVHDTAAHLQTLKAAVREHPEHRLHAPVAELAAAIEARAAELPPLHAARPRIVHGDPKLNNFLFADEATPRVHCLVDLDTVAPMPLALELGDAWRSWCNRAGENDAAARFDLDVLDAGLRGYARGCALVLTPTERDSLRVGLDWITLELAARFAADALAERYFGWDATRYPAAGEHNLVRARGQWSLHEAAWAARDARDALHATHLG